MASDKQIIPYNRGWYQRNKLKMQYTGIALLVVGIFHAGFFTGRKYEQETNRMPEYDVERVEMNGREYMKGNNRYQETEMKTFKILPEKRNYIKTRPNPKKNEIYNEI